MTITYHEKRHSEYCTRRGSVPDDLTGLLAFEAD